MADGREGVDDVLVVDDNPGDRRFIEEALQASQLPLRVHTVKSRDEALNVVSQRGEHGETPEPAIILLDWKLSHETGEEVINAAKSGDSCIPVVVMSGSSAEMIDAKSELSKADMFIEKTTAPEGYIEPLESLLSDQ